MLAAVYDQGTVWNGAIGQGLPDAGIHDAQPATVKVNPAWAAQPMLAVHRVAKLPDQQTLMGEVFRDTRFPHQPSRKTLFDTIKVLAATGNVSPEQGLWLADNKTYPNRLWSAIGLLSKQAAQDNDATILHGLHDHLLNLAPIKDVARFALAWAKHLPDVVDAQLVYQLRSMARTERNPRTTIPFDWTLFNASLANTVNAIVDTLNGRMAPDPSAIGHDFELTLGFAYDITDEGAIIAGADHSMGVELNFSCDNLQAPYWKAFVHGLTLLQQYLFPINTTSDLIQHQDMFMEETAEDLHAIWNWLAQHDLEDTEENVEAAIEAVDGFVIETPCAYEEFSSRYYQGLEITENWTMNKPLSVHRFKCQIARLPEPADDIEANLRCWFQELAQALPKSKSAPKWFERLRDYEVSDTGLTLLDEFTPIYCCDEYPARNAAEDQHQFYMQGDDRDPVKFAWNTDPASLLAWADSMRVGQTLIAKLYAASNPNHLC